MSAGLYEEPEGSPFRITVLVSRNGSSPSVPPSRPMPDCLKPPNAIPKSVRKALCPTVPDRSWPATCSRPVDVVGEDGGVEAVDRVVGERHGVVLVVGRNHAEHRPEDLLAGDGRVVVDVAEDGRLDVVAAVEVLGPTAAGRERRALGDALGDVPLDPVTLAVHGERPHLRLADRRGRPP